MSDEIQFQRTETGQTIECPEDLPQILPFERYKAHIGQLLQNHAEKEYIEAARQATTAPVARFEEGPIPE